MEYRQNKTAGADLAFVETALHLAAVEPLGLSWQAHDSADLVKRGLSTRTKRRQRITQIDCILRVPVEIGPG